MLAHRTTQGAKVPTEIVEGATVSHARRTVGTFAAITTVIATSLALVVSSASAGRVDPPGHQTANHCFNASGVDLNVLYGVPEQFRTRECDVISAGEHWIRPLWWIVDDGSVNSYPAGYVPSHPAPLDDFISKLVAVKIVIDAGTSREKTYSFDRTVVRADINIEQLDPGVFGHPFPMASMLPRLQPLSVGAHTHQPFIVLSAVHCDGLGAAAENCLPAGEIPFIPPRPLTVTTPAK